MQGEIWQKLNEIHANIFERELFGKTFAFILRNETVQLIWWSKELDYV